MHVIVCLFRVNHISFPIIILLKYIVINVVDDLTWDWINQKLYWADAGQSDIEVLDPNTGFRKVLFNSADGLRNPSGLIADPTTG